MHKQNAMKPLSRYSCVLAMRTLDQGSGITGALDGGGGGSHVDFEKYWQCLMTVSLILHVKFKNSCRI